MLALEISEAEAQHKYDLESVIDSLSKLAFFEDLSDGAKLTLERNIAVLEKMRERADVDV